MHVVYMCFWFLHKLYYALFLVCLWDALFVSESFTSKRQRTADDDLFLPKLTVESEQIVALQPLNHLCLDNARNFLRWWTYIICFQKGAVQIHLDLSQGQLTQTNYLGSFVPNESSPDRQVYREDAASCDASTDDFQSYTAREAIVNIRCCDLSKLDERWLKQSRHSLLPDLSFAGVDPTDQAELLTTAWLLYEDEAQRSLDQTIDTTANTNAFILSAEEPTTCTYEITVCSVLICERDEDKKALPTAKSDDHGTARDTASSEHEADDAIPLSPVMEEAGADDGPVRAALEMSRDEQDELKERTRKAFYHSYNSYMTYAYPQAELKPISCSGGNFDLIKIPLVTLIDSLDTLVILGNYSEFRRVVSLVSSELPSFNLDVNVSVFETTIRVLGGLLSAHLMATDPELQIYPPSHSVPDGPMRYTGRLLQLSLDLGERLMPAFATRTGIPYGTVNLRFGVPSGETKIASTAGAGSLLLEFQVLSQLSGQVKFGAAAYTATTALYERRSSIGLLGKHINTETGKWSESLSGVGSNADSFYEYLLKAYLLFRSRELFDMFAESYRAIKRFVLVNDLWFSEVDMFSGKMMRKRMESLDAFWPGMEALLGHADSSALQLNTFYSVWADLGFFPEEIDYAQWQLGKGAMNGLYPLRPEIIESTYHHYRTTGDRSWLAAGKLFLESLEQFAQTECGFATIADVESMALEDSMPSFFLSETCKYLFLLFDEDNFVHRRPYVFTTEAHPFDVLQIHRGDVRPHKKEDMFEGSVSTMGTNVDVAVVADGSELSVAVTTSGKHEKRSSFLRDKHKKKTAKASSLELVENPVLTLAQRQHLAFLEMLTKSNVLHASLQHELQKQLVLLDPSTQQLPVVPVGCVDCEEGRPEEEERGPVMEALRCRRALYWDASAAYDDEFLQEANCKLRKQVFASKRTTGRGRASFQIDLGDDGSRALRVKKGMASVKWRLHLLIGYMQVVAEYRRRLSQSAGEESERLLQVEVWRQAERMSMRRRTSLNTLRPRTQFCPRSDGPDITSTTKSASEGGSNAAQTVGGGKSIPRKDEGTAVASDPDVLKTVQVSMGPLGEFVVKVYTDAFAITNLNDGIKMEISNVGKPVVMVKETILGSVPRVLTADHRRYSVDRCTVSVSRTKKKNGFSLGDIWERPCSIANFGLTAKRIDVRLSADLVLPGYGSDRMCQTAKEHFKGAIDELRGQRWWPWGNSDYQQYTHDPVLVRAAQHGPLFPNKLLLVDRGDCLFEDKAVNAAAEGAVGVIIRNTEDTVFIMAGKREVEAADKSMRKALASPEHAQPVASTTSKKSSEDLPTVMLTKSDAADLEELIQLSTHLTDFSTQYWITSHARHMVLSCELFGDFDYPKVWSQEHLIFVLGQGQWGAYLKRSMADNWQLFVVSRDDLYRAQHVLAPPYSIPTAESRLPVDLPASVLTDSVQLYAYTLQRKCPNIVRRDRDGVMVVRSVHTSR